MQCLWCFLGLKNSHFNVNALKRRIKGKVLYNEVINDMSVDTTPVVRLLSTDGTEIIEGNVSKTASFTYFYDINIMNLNPYKEYILQAGTKDVNSIPKNNIITLPIKNQIMGTIYGMEINVENNKIILNSPTYDGFLNSYPFIFKRRCKQQKNIVFFFNTI